MQKKYAHIHAVPVRSFTRVGIRGAYLSIHREHSLHPYLRITPPPNAKGVALNSEVFACRKREFEQRGDEKGSRVGGWVYLTEIATVGGH